MINKKRIVLNSFTCLFFILSITFTAVISNIRVGSDIKEIIRFAVFLLVSIEFTACAIIVNIRNVFFEWKLFALSLSLFIPVISVTVIVLGIEIAVVGSEHTFLFLSLILVALLKIVPIVVSFTAPSRTSSRNTDNNDKYFMDLHKMIHK